MHLLDHIQLLFDVTLHPPKGNVRTYQEMRGILSVIAEKYEHTMQKRQTVYLEVGRELLLSSQNSDFQTVDSRILS